MKMLLSRKTPPQINLLPASRTPLVSDADLIQPRKVALGGAAQPRRKPDLKYLWIVGAILIAVLLLFALILLAPERPLPAVTPEVETPYEAISQPIEPTAPTPLETERQKRALENARAIVKRFTETEIELEDTWNVSAWGEAALDSAQAAAADAEAAFAGGEYDRALLGYQQAAAQLEALLDEAKREYAEAIANAVQALNQRDAIIARDALAKAALYQPESAMVESSRQRLERLPELTALLDKATQAESTGDISGAIRMIEAARALDASTDGISSRLARLRQTRFDARFQRILADGYEALDQSDYAAAEDAFSKALGMKPNDPGAQQGLEQTQLHHTNKKIQSSLNEAQVFVQDEDWAQAIAAFERVLEVDANLHEAAAGLAQARSRQSLENDLAHIIADPGALADEQQYARALALLQTARNTLPQGIQLDQKIEKLAAQVERASLPVQLTLVSDANTDVRLQYHGDLGRFSTKRIETRPGRYLVRGGRDGFREVRFEVDLAPGPQRLEIICTEPIN